MKMNNGLRDLLEQMSTAELDSLLQAELEKRPLDGTAVNLIMEILSERDIAEPLEINAEIQAAWEEYNIQSDMTNGPKGVWRSRSLLLRVASVLLVLGAFYFILPQDAGAKSLWDRFLYVTDSIFEFFNPSDANDHRVEYSFETDNPGLQQVYDAVAELGTTDPVVPMWLPEGYELVELDVRDTRARTKIYARFEMHSNVMVYGVEIYNAPSAHDFFKDETNYLAKEYGGVTHNVMQNNDMLVAIWVRDNVECSLTTNCQEDELYEILKSIYVMGE